MAYSLMGIFNNLYFKKLLNASNTFTYISKCHYYKRKTACSYRSWTRRKLIICYIKRKKIRSLVYYFFISKKIQFLQFESNIQILGTAPQTMMSFKYGFNLQKCYQLVSIVSLKI